MAQSDVIEFANTTQESRGALYPGRFKLQSNLISFKNQKTGRVDQFQPTNLEQAIWTSTVRGPRLKLLFRDKITSHFDGFKEEDFEKINSFFKRHFDVELEKRELSLKGWNWGNLSFDRGDLEFQVDGRTSFEVPLGNVASASYAKNEAIVNFHTNDDAPVSLFEMRFHVPSSGEGGPGAGDRDFGDEFMRHVISRAEVIMAAGDTIVEFKELLLLTPRGRYDMRLYPSFLQLHGKSFDYKIPFAHILRLFLLPHRDTRQMFFVINIDPPLKQGQTRYPFLIAVFNKENETSIELHLTDEEIATKYDGKLQRRMNGPEYEIVTRIMKTLTTKKLIFPNAFMGHSGSPAIQASYKTAVGFLYPLERGFIFVHKPPVYLRFEEIAFVNFSRSTGSNRSFDFEIESKANATFTFSSIDKEEYSKLFDFVEHHRLPCKNIGRRLDQNAVYEGEEGSEDEEPDAYLQRVKAEGKRREETGEMDEVASGDEEAGGRRPERAAKRMADAMRKADERALRRAGAADDDDDDEEEGDQDFVAPASGSDDVDEEYDTNASGSGSEAEDGDHHRHHKLAKTVPETDSSRPAKRDKQKRHREEKDDEGKRKKKTKDKNAPKRAMSAYFLWFNANRNAIKEKNPGASITEISKKAGEEWKKLSTAEKVPWEEKQKEDKKRYEQEMEAYREQVKNMPPEERAGGKEKVKKAKSAGVSKGKSDSVMPKSKETISDDDTSSSSAISGASGSESDTDRQPLAKKANKGPAPQKPKSKSKSDESEEPSSDDDSD